VTEVPTLRSLKRAVPAFGTLVLVFAALAATGAALADAPADAKARSKASSFAPHHTKGRNYGAPVSRPILHKRKKHPPSAAPPESIK
jgi:hypothetical protein